MTWVKSHSDQRGEGEHFTPRNETGTTKDRFSAASDCQKSFTGGVGGSAGPLTVIVSRGFAARAGRFRHQPKPFLTFFAAVSFS